MAYLKDGNPGIEDVVEVDGPLKWVDHTIRAVGVVLVPVDAGGVISAVGVHVQVALNSTFLIQLGHRVAVPHAVISGLRADEGVLVVVFSVVVFRERASGKKRRGMIPSAGHYGVNYANLQALVNISPCKLLVIAGNKAVVAKLLSLLK